MGNLAVKPYIANEGADRFYDCFSHSFQALKSEVDDYMDLLRVLSTQLQYVPPEQETFHLSINGRPIGLALLAIANALNGDTHVAQLSLETTNIDKENIGILASVLMVNHTLKELYLTGNNLGAEGIKVLLKALSGNTTLVTLHLGSTACGDDGCTAIADLLGSGKTGLRRLNLCRNGITEAGFAALEESVRQNELVVEVDLRDNNIPKEMTDSLNELLKLRFKPYMEELKRQEDLQELYRKSARDSPKGKKHANNKGSKPKALSSLKLKLAKKRPSLKKMPSPKGGGGSRSEESSPRDKEPDKLSSSAPDDKDGDEQLAMLDFLRTVDPDTLNQGAPPMHPAPRPKRGAKKSGGAGEDSAAADLPKSSSAPNSPRESFAANPQLKEVAGKSRSGSVAAEPLGRSKGRASSPTQQEAAPTKPMLRLHIIEAARLKPVQKNGASDPFCHAGSFEDARGKKIATSVQKRTLSPQWDQWFDVALDDLSDWMFQLHLQDAKLTGDKGKLGHVVVSCKDWDLSDEAGQEQWVDVVDGLGALKLGLQAEGANLIVCKALSAKRKEAEKKERDAQAAAIEQRSGRPRGRTMLAPPAVKVAPVPPPPSIPHTKPALRIVGVAETIGRRPTMEDSILVQGSLGGDVQRDLFAVFDGHGSQKVALYCAEKFGEVLMRHLNAGAEPLVALRSTFLDLSAEVAPWAINMGCTAVAALLVGRAIHVANCGDTRAVLCSSAGIVERLTLDHKPSLPEEVSRIEALGGVVRNGRVQGQLAVSRALGDANFAPFITPEPYLRSVSCTEENTHLILACDGLWDVFPDSLAGQIVANQPEPTQAAAMLRDRAFASGSTDNISVIVVRLQIAEEKAPEPQKTPAAPEDSSTSEASNFDDDDDDDVPFSKVGERAEMAEKRAANDPPRPLSGDLPSNKLAN